MTTIIETQLRQEIVRVAKVVAEQGLSCSSDGNISTRLDNEKILITPSLLYKRWMDVDDLIVIDAEGKVLAGKPGLKPSSELHLHIETYRLRPDVLAVLHAHPPYATALTIAGIPFPLHLTPEAALDLGEIPVAPYATPETNDLGYSIKGLIEEHDAILLSHHGSLTVGTTLLKTLITLERMEHVARLYFMAHAMGNPIPLPAGEIERLRAVRNKQFDQEFSSKKSI